MKEVQGKESELQGEIDRSIANAITALSVHGATDDCCVTNLWGLDYPVWVAYFNWRIPTPELLIIIMTRLKEERRFAIYVSTHFLTESIEQIHL